jgi:hypothetical protein
MAKSNDLNIRKTIALPESMWRDIAHYQTQERILTEAEAVRRLVQMSLRSLQRRAVALRAPVADTVAGA